METLERRVASLERSVRRHRMGWMALGAVAIVACIGGAAAQSIKNVMHLRAQTIELWNRDLGQVRYNVGDTLDLIAKHLQWTGERLDKLEVRTGRLYESSPLAAADREAAEKARQHQEALAQQQALTAELARLRAEIAAAHQQASEAAQRAHLDAMTRELDGFGGWNDPG